MYTYIRTPPSLSLQTELTSQNSPSCILRILPRYKVRSVGDEVSAQVKGEGVARRSMGFVQSGTFSILHAFIVQKSCERASSVTYVGANKEMGIYNYVALYISIG